MTQSKPIEMSQTSLDTLLQMVGIIGTISGTVGSGTALIVDFYRRRVRAKAADYAAQNDFARLENAMELLQSTVNQHVITAASQHSELCQRVARMEGKHDS